jgi:hypothetical protein
MVDVASDDLENDVRSLEKAFGSFSKLNNKKVQSESLHRSGGHHHVKSDSERLLATQDQSSSLMSVLALPKLRVRWKVAFLLILAN